MNKTKPCDRNMAPVQNGMLCLDATMLQFQLRLPNM